MLYKNEIYHPVRIGQWIPAYIKKVRDDNKLDLSLYQPGYDKVKEVEEDILKFLKEKGGFIQITDKTSPEMIHRIFKISKRTYKKAIGALYKKNIISIEEEGIRLNNELPASHTAK
jgi:predicted RNA-binding protein (virulence factor B family)